MPDSIYHCTKCDKSFKNERALCGHMHIHAASYSKTQQNTTNQNNITRINYANNPVHCKECDCCIPYDRRVNKFCSSSCSGINTNRLRYKNGYSMLVSGRKAISLKLSNLISTKPKQQSINQIKSKSKLYSKVYPCNACGKYYRCKLDKDICSCGLSCKFKLFPALQTYFNFDSSVVGTKIVIQEFEKCKNHVKDLYNQNSLPSLCKLVNHPNAGNLGKILKSLGIKLDDLSTSQSKSYLQNRTTLPLSPHNHYKQGWFTSKTGRMYYYRSSYELKFIEQLEDINIEFEMELPFRYYDSIREKYRTALPDFIFHGKIVEIKSDYTFDEINMIDKFTSYVEHGYDPILQLEFKYYKLIDGLFTLIPDYKLT